MSRLVPLVRRLTPFRLARQWTRLMLCAGLSAMGTAHADFDAAMDRYRRHDLLAAHEEFLHLARIGDPAAQFNLGVMALHGDGTAKDLRDAYAWMALACPDKCDQDAWRQVRDEVWKQLPPDQQEEAAGRRAVLSSRYSEGGLRTWLHALHPGAGDTPHAEEHEHRQILTRRVEPHLVTYLAEELSAGTATTVFHVAPDGSTRLQGLEATTNRGWGHEAGEAIRRFRFSPLGWPGHSLESVTRRQVFVVRIEGVNVDLKGLYEDLHRSERQAASGKPYDLWNHGRTLAALQTIEPSVVGRQHPADWYLKAALLGYPPAEYSLANELLIGEDCTPDPELAMDWLRAAAEARQPDAQFQLGLDLVEHPRSSTDLQAGIGWLEQAQAQGYRYAALYLAWLRATHPDPEYRDARQAATLANAQLDAVLDRLSLLETRAAVAALQGDFEHAQREAEHAHDEAVRLDQPSGRADAMLAAYRQHQLWFDPDLQAPPAASGTR